MLCNITNSLKFLTFFGSDDIPTLYEHKDTQISKVPIRNSEQFRLFHVLNSVKSSLRFIAQLQVLDWEILNPRFWFLSNRFSGNFEYWR